jgi:hypothetical protein
MAANKPVVGQIPHSNRKIPISRTPTKPSRWTFSFRYWRQIEYFGLDKVQPAWFVSLLERLVDLSSQRIDDFFSNSPTKSYYRYHEIDWDQKKIPIKREDLTWLDHDYLVNAEDYPLVQFMVSKALGRIVGFWDEEYAFCIVLLDPLHNLQPSKFHSYRIDPCSPLSCEYTALLLDMQEARGLECTNTSCPVRAALDAIPNLGHGREVMLVSLGEGIAEWVHSLVASNRVESPAEILETGLLTLDKDYLA